MLTKIRQLTPEIITKIKLLNTETITEIRVEHIYQAQRQQMINYEEELKKFKPSLDVDEAEGAIYSRDLTDVIDILQEMLKETSGKKRDWE